MDEFLDRNGRTISESHPMSFKGDMKRNFYDLIRPELRMPIDHMHFPGSLLKIRKKRDGLLEKQNMTVWTTPVESGTIFSKTMS